MSFRSDTKFRLSYGDKYLLVVLGRGPRPDPGRAWAKPRPGPQAQGQIKSPGTKKQRAQGTSPRNTRRTGQIRFN